MLWTHLNHANDIEPSKEYYNATFIPNSIVIDGSLDEWTGVPVLSDPKFAIPKSSGTNGTYVLFEPYNGGTWSGPDDQTSAVQVVWDADNLYLGVTVTDDYHENSANSPWKLPTAALRKPRQNQWVWTSSCPLNKREIPMRMFPLIFITFFRARFAS